MISKALRNSSWCLFFKCSFGKSSNALKLVAPQAFTITKKQKLNFKNLSEIPSESIWLAIKERKIELVVGNEENIITFLSFVIKRQVVQRIPDETLEPVFEFLLDRSAEMSPEQIAAVAVLLQKTKCKQEELLKRLEETVIQRATQFSLRALANTVHAFAEAEKNQERIAGYSALFRELETVLTIHLARSDFHEKDLLGVVLAYSKTSSASPEFLQVLYEVALSAAPSLTPGVLVPVLYSLTLAHVDKSKKLLAFTTRHFLQNSSLFKQKEMATLFSIIFGKSNMESSFESSSAGLLEKFLKEFSLRLSSTNIQDLTLISSTLSHLLNRIPFDDKNNEAETGSFSRENSEDSPLKSQKEGEMADASLFVSTLKKGEAETQPARITRFFEEFISPAWVSLHMNCDLKGLERMLRATGWLVQIDKNWSRNHLSLMKKVLKHYARKTEKRGVHFEEIRKSISQIQDEKVRLSFERAMTPQPERHKGKDTYMAFKKTKSLKSHS